MKKKIAVKKKVVKRRATHRATMDSTKAMGKSEREIQDHQDMERLKQEKEQLQLNPEKQRELGEQQKKKFNDVEREIIEVLNRHGIPVQSEFVVQIRSWFFEARNQNVPPEMREGPGVALTEAAA